MRGGDPRTRQGELVGAVNDEHDRPDTPICMTRIRNGQSARKTSVHGSRASKTEDGRILEGAEGRGVYRGLQSRPGRWQAVPDDWLKYYEGRPVIDRIERVSRPGLRIYRGKERDSAGDWAAWVP